MKRIVLALLFLCAPAMAQAPARPPLIYDPDKFEYATPWAQSSPCLGDETDGICLAATAAVCSVVRTRTECLPDGRYPQIHNPLDSDRIEYRILRAGYIPERRVRQLSGAPLYLEDILKFDERRVPPTVAQVAIRIRICDPRHSPCATERTTELIFYLEFRRARWIFLDSILHAPDLWLAE